MTVQYASIIDVRRIPHHNRHALIFGTFDVLPGGEALQLINDHDPKPLYYQFENNFPAGSFEWTYLEAGPSQWRVEIAKRGGESSHGAGESCCSGGGCGG